MKNTNEAFAKYRAKIAQRKKQVIEEILVNQENPEIILQLQATLESCEWLDELFKNPALYQNGPRLSEKEFEEKYPGVLFVIKKVANYLNS